MRLFKPKEVVGVDIGTSSIKLVELEPGPGRARLVRATIVPLDGGAGGAELVGDGRSGAPPL